MPKLPFKPSLRHLGYLGYLLVLAILIATFLPIAAETLLKRGMSDWLLTHKQRQLKLEGEPILHFWPQPTLELPPITLSEAGSPKTFAKLSSARFSLQWLPLLRRRLLIDHIDIQGLQLTLSRDANGLLNIADFLEPGEASSFSTEIRLLELKQANITWHDAKNDPADQTIRMENINLRCHALAAVSQGDCRLSVQTGINGKPALNGQLTLEATHRLNSPKQQYTLENLHLHLLNPEGTDIRLNAGQLSATTRPALNVQAREAHLKARHTPAGSSLNLDLELTAPTIQLTAERLNIDKTTLLAHLQTNTGRLHAELSSPLVAELPSKILSLPGLQGRIELVHPRLKPASLPLSLRGNIASTLSNLETAGELSGHLPDSAMNARFKLQTQAARPVLAFELDIDHLDADRLLRPETESPPTKILPGHAAGTSAGAHTGIDLQGRLNIGTLKFSGITVRKFSLRQGEAGILPRPGNVASPN